MHSSRFWQGEWILNDEPLILIVADDPRFRAFIMNSLKALAGVEVLDANNLQDGTEILYALEPELLITDLDLPDGSGLQLIASIHGEGMKTSTLVIATARAPLGRLQPLCKNIHVCWKPLHPERLRQLSEKFTLVEPAVQTHMLTGDHRSATTMDYIQLGCLGRCSLQLTITRGAIDLGVMYIHRGTLWTAETALDTGEAALRRLLNEDEVRVEVQALERDDPGPRDLEFPWYART